MDPTSPGQPSRPIPWLRWALVVAFVIAGLVLYFTLVPTSTPVLPLDGVAREP